VVGITAPDGFRAHAWLQGDPVPAADDAELDASVLGTSPGKSWTAAPDRASRRGEVSRDSEGTVTRFNELLRRPAPRYTRHESMRVR
jgi:hypothetical protein